MVSASVTTAAVSALTVLVIVVVTVHVRVIAESACDECIDGSICISADTTVEADADLGECHLCTTTYENGTVVETDLAKQIVTVDGTAYAMADYVEEGSWNEA